NQPGTTLGRKRADLLQQIVRRLLFAGHPNEKMYFDLPATLDLPGAKRLHTIVADHILQLELTVKTHAGHLLVPCGMPPFAAAPPSCTTRTRGNGDNLRSDATCATPVSFRSVFSRVESITINRIFAARRPQP